MEDSDDRTLEKKVQGMRQFYKDLIDMVPHYNITQHDALSVYAKLLIQAAIFHGDSKEEMLRDMAMLYDFEKFISTTPKDIH